MRGKPTLGEGDAEVTAYFDMDMTLVGANTGKLWIREAFSRGELSLLTLARLMFAVTRYRLGLMDPGPLMTAAIETLEGTPEAEIRQQCLEFFEVIVKPHILPRAVERLRDHQARGHHVVVLSASTPYMVEPLARHLGIADALCTRLHVSEGTLTGQVVQPLCYGAGKLEVARAFSDARGADLGRAWFYTDSIHDLAVMEAVGHPVAVNPDMRLERVARRRGWPVEDFFGAVASVEGSNPHA